MISYRPPKRLPGGHAQTIYPLLIKPAALPYRRQRQPPDGGFIDLDFPQQGGHVGFVSGSLSGKLDWLAGRILHFFQHEVRDEHALAP